LLMATDPGQGCSTLSTESEKQQWLTI